MNLRKRTTAAHRTRPRSLAGLVIVSGLLLGGGIGGMAIWQVDHVPAPKPVAAAAPDIPEGVLVIRHGTQIQRYVAAEPTILCPDGTVRPMSNYRHICELGWKQP
jgi:hypothetical protein